EAIALLAHACATVECEPVQTNAWFLGRLLECAPFRTGTMTTNTIAEFGETLMAPPQPSEDALQAGAEAAIFDKRFQRAQLGEPAFDRFVGLLGFRLNA